MGRFPKTKGQVFSHWCSSSKTEKETENEKERKEM